MGYDDAERNRIADKCNYIFDKWLSEQPVVYGRTGTQNLWHSDKFESSLSTVLSDTHRAILCCIEPLKSECEHEPIEVASFEAAVRGGEWTIKCKHCGIKLKAIWSQV